MTKWSTEFLEVFRNPPTPGRSHSHWIRLSPVSRYPGRLCSPEERSGRYQALRLATPENGVVKAGFGPINVFDADVDWTGRKIWTADLVSWLHAHADARRLVLRGARVVPGHQKPMSLDLTDFRSKTALVLHDCSLEAPLDFRGATTGRLEIRGCRLQQGLLLENAQVQGELLVKEGTRIGPVPQSGTGNVVNTRAIDADSLDVAGNFFIEGVNTCLNGALRLGGATVGGQLAVTSGAQIAPDRDGNAIDSNILKVSKDLCIQGDGTRLKGALRLNGAIIGGQLAVIGGAQIAPDRDGNAIDGDGLKVARDLVIQAANTRVGGRLRLGGATIGGQFAVNEGAENIVAASDDVADGGIHREIPECNDTQRACQLDVCNGVWVAGDVELDGADVTTLDVRSGRIDGKVDLTNARVGRLLDTPQGWSQVLGGWQLAGVTIEALSGTLTGEPEWTTTQRIAWLKNDATRARRPFTQIASLYRQAGHHHQSRRISRAGETATSSRRRQLWAGVTVGYGYQPSRAAWIAILFLMLAWGAVSLSDSSDELFIPTNGEENATCPADYPCLNRFAYAAETVLPVVAFGQRDAWRIDTSVTYGQWVQSGQYALDGLGWLLALLVIAAVSGWIRQE